MVVLPEHRLVVEVGQGVVHPAHVPLEAEAEPAQVHGPGDAGPRGRLLGDRDDAGRLAVGDGVHLLEELHGVEVLAPAVDVGSPLALAPGVVQIQHRGDRVHAQAVDVELLEPVDGVRDQEVAYLPAAEVEDVGAPFGVLAALGVGMLVQRRAVEPGQRPRVHGEVGGHPVEEHADAGLVQLVDEVPELVGAAETRRGRVVGGDLVAPGAAERVLGHRQELHVREAHVTHVLHELGRQLLVRQSGTPRAEVHLVGAHRRLHRVALGPPAHPLVVLPGVLGPVDDRGRGGRALGAAGHRVGLGPPDGVRAQDRELVVLTHPDPRDEQLPHPGPAERPHRVPGAVPVVEAALHAHPERVRRPDGEGRAVLVVVPHDPGAEHLPQALVAALADQVQVDLAQGGPVAVRITGLEGFGARVGHP